MGYNYDLKKLREQLAEVKSELESADKRNMELSNEIDKLKLLLRDATNDVYDAKLAVYDLIDVIDEYIENTALAKSGA